LKKKKQKTFARCFSQPFPASNTGATPNEEKFFGSFFQKRTFFLSPSLAGQAQAAVE
jgi:hypothetical protein